MDHSKTRTLILAGRRTKDPLADHFSVPNKAFVPLHGKPLIRWVFDKLKKNDLVQDLWLSLNPEQESIFRESFADMPFQVAYTSGESSPVPTALKLYEELEVGQSLLVTTADNPLLASEVLQYFLRECTSTISMGLVNGHEGFLDLFPDMYKKRTWHKINRKVWLSGANLFLLHKREAEIPEALQDFRNWEASRKSAETIRKLISGSQWWLFVKYLFQSATVPECNRSISQTMGVDIELKVLPFPLACLDVDKLDDHEFISQLPMTD